MSGSTYQPQESRETQVRETESQRERHDKLEGEGRGVETFFTGQHSKFILLSIRSFKPKYTSLNEDK